MYRSFALLCLCLFSFTSPVSASPSEQAPRIGLVLSGGGAKGGAHLGVIRRLEELQIPIDYVAGTSMGSYFAALMAMGYDADQIEQIALSADWLGAFSDQAGRETMPMLRKEQLDRFPFATLVGFDREGIKVAKGMVQGQQMAALLRHSVNYLPQLASFDALPIPYRAVATDLSTMQPITLASGDLALAMQASMTVPGALRPVTIDGMSLIDGGVSNNLPVQQVLDMGADLVIAVDVGSVLKPADELPSAVHLLDQLSNQLLRIGTDQQLALMGKQDILITPNIDGLGSLDFQQLPLAAERGYQAAVKALSPEILAAYTQRDYASYRQHIEAQQAQLLDATTRTISEVELYNQSDWSAETIMRRLEVQSYQAFSPQRLEENIEQLYAQNSFERIDYTRRQATPDEDVLEIHANRKSWGPGYLDFAFHLQDTGRNSPEIMVGLATTVKDLNSVGAHWRTELALGTNRELVTEFYTPLSYDLDYFSRAKLGVNKIKDHYYISPYSNAFHQFGYSTVSAQWAVGKHLTYASELSLQLLGQKRHIDLQGQLTHETESIVQPSLAYRHDTLNSAGFPTRGDYLEASIGLQYRDETRQTDPIWETRWNKMLKSGRHNLRWVGELGGTGADTLSPANMQRLGGLGRMSGFQPNRLAARYKSMTGLVYYYALAERQLAGFTLPVYAGMTAEYGALWFDEDNPISNDFVSGAGSVFAAIDVNQTWPIVVGYGANGLNTTVYLQVGHGF